jgi:hypothetical protein
MAGEGKRRKCGKAIARYLMVSDRKAIGVNSIYCFTVAPL